MKKYDIKEFNVIADGKTLCTSAVEKTRFIISNEYELMFPQAQVILKADGSKYLYVDCKTHQSYFDEKIEDELKKWHVECLSKTENTHLIVTLRKEEVGFVRLPYKIMLKTDKCVWSEEPNPVRVLGKTLLSPGWFGWLI